MIQVKLLDIDSCLLLLHLCQLFQLDPDAVPATKVDVIDAISTQTSNLRLLVEP